MMPTKNIPTGLYPDLDEDDYHADPALSTSRAKLLLPPSCPAKFRHSLDNPRPAKRAYDVGHVAHELILGKGAGFAVLPFADRRTNAYKAAEAEAREAGLVPILEADYEAAVGMAEAVAAHDVAGELFTDGRAEVSAFWPDEETGLMRRARFDWLRNPPPPGQRLRIVDLKTARSAEPEQFGKAAADYGYAMQAANYLDGARYLSLGEDPQFLFVVVEKEPPHVVTVGELDGEALMIGRYLMRQAIGIYADCITNERWPGYAEGIATFSLPSWFAYQHTADDMSL